MYGSAWNARRLGMTAYRKGKGVGELRSDVWTRLSGIQPSHSGAYPASADLRDGTHHDFVLFFEEGSSKQELWIPKVGILRRLYVHKDTQTRLIEPESVMSVSQNPHRTPLDIEKQMMDMPSYSMGSEGLVIIQMTDKKQFVAGPTYEFLVLPQGYSTTEIALMTRFDSNEDASSDLPDIAPMLCLFKRPSKN